MKPQPLLASFFLWLRLILWLLGIANGLFSAFADKFLREESEYIEVPRDKYERLQAVIKEMCTPYHSASDLIHKQVDEVLEKYGAWLQRKEHEKRQRKVG
jgi:peroxiredoxin